MTSKRSRSEYEGLLQPFAVYGTPLPPLDSQTRDDGSYVPIWKQEARDDKGRKRFHGAFTGGFSAGYYNTVGSKEGWTPSTWVSSRHDRRKDDTELRQSRPEDFMDEEDLADLQQAQKIETNRDFMGRGGLYMTSEDRDPLASLFGDSKGMMGMQLLKRMGWKPGQGIGPKLLRHAKVDVLNVKEYLFAPDETPVYSQKRKTDKFGLGWDCGDRLDVAVSKDRSKTLIKTHATESGRIKQNTSRAPDKTAGFGVGVLNATGSDDEDVYELGPKISYNRVVGNDKKKKKLGVVVMPSKKIISTTSSNSMTQSSPKYARCCDGRLPLEGFVLAERLPPLDQSTPIFAIPAVPADWQPANLYNPSSQSNKATSQVSIVEAARMSILDPRQRAGLLGETLLPGKSVFDFIKPAIRDQLVNATGVNLPQGKGESAPEGFEATEADRHKSMWDLVPRLERATAQAALDRGSSGWMPYAEDLKKRSRYRSFLESLTGLRPDLPIREANMSTDEWAAEMREFAQAAMVFKPVSGLMASRFTSAKDAPIGQSTAADRDEKDNLTLGKLSEPKVLDPAEEAARLGMYGPLTRSQFDFYPTRLLCKRFGVKPPAHVINMPDTKLQNQGTKMNPNLTLPMGESITSSYTKDSVMDTILNDTVANSSVRRASMDGVAEVNIEQNIALEGQKAGEDLFRAVFGDSDEDD